MCLSFWNVEYCVQGGKKQDQIIFILPITGNLQYEQELQNTSNLEFEKFQESF